MIDVWWFFGGIVIGSIIGEIALILIERKLQHRGKK